MKELSIEQKAKRYDEALKAAIVAHKDEDRHLKATLERIFPELAESEDEMIRKWIIAYLENRVMNTSITDEKDNCLDAIRWLKNQGEQKPIDVRTTGYWHVEDVEQKPAWSEEDGKIVEALNAYVKNLDMFFSEIKIGDKNIPSKEFREKVQLWLKSLKDRVQPHLKQEWSEKDDEHLERILKELENQYQRPINSPYLDKIESDYNWLKSLKPQNKWKPSDEQMEALLYEVNAWDEDSVNGQNLKSLYQNLKKLREE